MQFYLLLLFIMRTTIDIDEKLIKEVMEITNARTKKEMINLSLNETIKQMLKERLKSRAGSGCLNLTLDELYKMREDDTECLL